MSRGLSVDPSDAVPLWKQIEENVRRLVASGAMKPGSAMPSVRDLARDLSINPATVAKGYQRLVDAGILAVKRGRGNVRGRKAAGPSARRAREGARRRRDAVRVRSPSRLVFRTRRRWSG